MHHHVAKLCQATNPQDPGGTEGRAVHIAIRPRHGRDIGTTTAEA